MFVCSYNTKTNSYSVSIEEGEKIVRTVFFGKSTFWSKFEKYFGSELMQKVQRSL